MEAVRWPGTARPYPQLGLFVQCGRSGDSQARRRRRGHDPVDVLALEDLVLEQLGRERLELGAMRANQGLGVALGLEGQLALLVVELAAVVLGDRVAVDR